MFARALMVAALCGFLAFDSPPAAALSRNYFCFFDEGRSDLTQFCRRALSDFVTYWRNSRDAGWRSYIAPFDVLPGQVVQVQVLGAAPDAGSPADQQRLGLLRALAVVEALRRLGIPDEILMPVSVGADLLLVPGEPRSAQNRVAYPRLTH